MGRRALSGLPFPLAKHVVAHFSGEDLAALGVGNAIPAWGDRIHGASAYQGTGGNRPTVAIGPTGRLAAYFVNSHWLRVDSKHILPFLLTGSQPNNLPTEYSVVVVFQGDGTLASHTGANCCVLGNVGNASGGCWIPGTGGSTGRSTTNIVPMDASTLQVVVLSQQPSLGNAANYTEFTAPTFINGTRLPSFTGYQNFGATDLVIGAGDASTARPCRGYIYDVIIIKKAATQLDAIDITKWAYDLARTAYPWTGLTYYPVYTGDSIPANVGQTAITEGYPYKICMGGFSYSLGLTVGQWGNHAVSGYTLNCNDHIAARHLDELSGKLGGIPLLYSHHSYRNDGNVGAGYVATINGYALRRKAKQVSSKVIFSTVASFSSVQNTQTLDPANRGLFNQAMSTTPAAALDGLVRLGFWGSSGGSTIIGPDNSFVTNPTYYHTDYVHYGNLGATEHATYEGPVAQAIIGGAVGLQVSSI